MKLIIGLGNPGEKYKNNRHNAGVLFIDYAIENSDFIFLRDNKLFKSTEFMNNSGRFIRAKSKFFNIDLNNLYIAHDDLDLPLGEFKIQKGVGPKKHNGIISIEDNLASTEFWRIRIGIDNRPARPAGGDSNNRINGEDYVLQNFEKQELEKLESVFEKILLELNNEL